MFELVILAVGLSMDAAAVSISLGLKSPHKSILFIVKVALIFGFFQALMPLIGYIFLMSLEEYLLSYVHYLSIFFLFLIGAKMIYESFYQENKSFTISNFILFTLAIATSIDALVAGISIEILDISLFLALIIIGLITILLSSFSVYIGYKGAKKYQRKAEIFGGIILIGLSIKTYFIFV